MSIKAPTPIVGVRLASIAIHAEEMVEDGHPLDIAAVRGLLADADVRAYLDYLRPLALLPVKRKGGN